MLCVLLLWFSGASHIASWKMPKLQRHAFDSGKRHRIWRNDRCFIQCSHAPTHFDDSEYCSYFTSILQISRASLAPESSYIAKPAASWLDDFLVWLSPEAFGCCRKFTNGSYCPPDDQVISWARRSEKSFLYGCVMSDEKMHFHLSWHPMMKVIQYSTKQLVYQSNVTLVLQCKEKN